MAELIPLDETIPIFDSRGRGTRRFNEYMRAVTSKVNDTTVVVEEVTEVAGQVSRMQSELGDIRSLIESLEASQSIPDNTGLIERINQLEANINVVDLTPILQRLDAIEAQL